MSPKNSRASVFIRAIFIIACVAGNMFQVYQISDSYFEYDMVSKFSIFIPEILDNIPSFTLCVNVVDILKWDILTNFTGNGLDKDSLLEYFKNTLSDYFNDTVSNYYLKDPKGFVRKIQSIQSKKKDRLTKIMDVKGMTARALLKRFTLSTRELFPERCWMVITSTGDPQGYGPCKHLFNVREYLSEADKCFSFNTSAAFDYFVVKRDHLNPGILMSIKIGELISDTRLNRSIFLFTNRNDIRRLGFDLFGSISDFKTERHISTQTYVYDLLPPPFRTKCRDFAEYYPDIVGRGACFEQCAYSKSNATFNGRIFSGITITGDEDEDVQLISPDRLKTETDMQEKVIRIYRDCDKTCSQNSCRKKTFLPIQISKFPYYTLRMDIHSPHLPHILVIFSPKTSIIEYFTDIGSTVGVWFGLGLTQLFSVFVDIIKRFTKNQKGRKMSKVTNNDSGTHNGWQRFQRVLWLFSLRTSDQTKWRYITMSMSRQTRSPTPKVSWGSLLWESDFQGEIRLTDTNSFCDTKGTCFGCKERKYTKTMSSSNFKCEWNFYDQAGRKGGEEECLTPRFQRRTHTYTYTHKGLSLSLLSHPSFHDGTLIIIIIIYVHDDQG